MREEDEKGNEMATMRSTISPKRTRAAAIHNQSERVRTERTTKLYDNFFIHIHLHHIHKLFLNRVAQISYLSYRQENNTLILNFLDHIVDLDSFFVELNFIDFKVFLIKWIRNVAFTGKPN